MLWFAHGPQPTAPPRTIPLLLTKITQRGYSTGSGDALLLHSENRRGSTAAVHLLQRVVPEHVSPVDFRFGHFFKSSMLMYLMQRLLLFLCASMLFITLPADEAPLPSVSAHRPGVQRRWRGAGRSLGAGERLARGLPHRRGRPLPSVTAPWHAHPASNGHGTQAAGAASDDHRGQPASRFQPHALAGAAHKARGGWRDLEQSANGRGRRDDSRAGRADARRTEHYATGYQRADYGGSGNKRGDGEVCFENIS